MKKATSEQVFEKLQKQLKKNCNGAIKFELSDFEIIVKQNNVVGNILEEWLDKWMTESGFSHDYNHAQSSPDFWLDVDNHDTEWLEIKAFTGSPNFDIANMMSYITEVIEKPWKLHSKYLCLKYKNGRRVRHRNGQRCLAKKCMGDFLPEFKMGGKGSR